jgi:hypothetical protein
VTTTRGRARMVSIGNVAIHVADLERSERFSS